VFSLGLKWNPEEILTMDSIFKQGQLQATINLSTANKKRRHSADLIGYVTFKGNRIIRFDLVSKAFFIRATLTPWSPGITPWRSHFLWRLAMIQLTGSPLSIFEEIIPSICVETVAVGTPVKPYD
jgi:hypothetical protein